YGWYPNHRLSPIDSRWIAALAGEEQGAEARQVVVPQQLAVGILLLDGAEGGRRGEQRDRLVLGDHAPEGAGVGRADRLAFVEDRGRAVEQRAVDGVAVADRPADVRGGPPHLARLDAVEVLHRPVERDAIAAGLVHHALWLPGRAGRIETVERIRRLDLHARMRRRLRHRLDPVEVAAGLHLGDRLRPLEQDDLRHLVGRYIDRLVEQWLVVDDAARLDATRRRQHQ